MTEAIHNFINHDQYNAILGVMLIAAIAIIASLTWRLVHKGSSPQRKRHPAKNETPCGSRLAGFCKNHSTALIFLAVFVALFCIPYLYNNHRALGCWLIGEVDELEGLFAPAAAFFSGAAFFFMYRSLKSQETQLYHMRQESIEKSFENVFFNLLKMHRENHLRLTAPQEIQQTAKSRHASHYFKKIHSELERAYRYQQHASKAIGGDQPFSDRISKNYITIFKFIDGCLKQKNHRSKKMAFYEAIFEMRKYEFTAYFRHYYHTLKYLHTAYKAQRISEELAFQYRDMLKGQITPHEHAVLYYNGLYFKQVKNKPGYYIMISDLKMLDDLDYTLLFDKGEAGYYPTTAFGDDKQPAWECYNG